MRHECDVCDERARNELSLCRKCLEYRCHAGIAEAVVPLFDDRGRIIGYLMMGKCRIEEEEEETLAKVKELIARHKLDSESTLAAFREIPVMSRKQFHDAVLYLQEIAKRLRNLRLESKKSCLDSLENELLLRVVQYVNGMYADRAICENIYHDLEIDRRAFEQACRESCGERPAEFIGDLNLTRSEDLLKNTKESAAGVAEILGYGYRAFVVFFRRRCGASPLQFRAHLKGKETPFGKSVSRDAIPFE